MPDLSNLHPLVVHFPIALLIVGALSDLLGMITKKDFFFRAGLFLLVLGAAGAVAAYFSGESAGEGLAEGGALKQALETHEGAAVLSLVLISATVLVRLALVLAKKFSGNLRWIPLVLFLITAGSIARTGHYGGQLVYKHAAGVQLTLGSDTFDASAAPDSVGVAEHPGQEGGRE